MAGLTFGFSCVHILHFQTAGAATLAADVGIKDAKFEAAVLAATSTPQQVTSPQPVPKTAANAAPGVPLNNSANTTTPPSASGAPAATTEKAATPTKELNSSNNNSSPKPTSQDKNEKDEAKMEKKSGKLEKLRTSSSRPKKTTPIQSSDHENEGDGVDPSETSEVEEDEPAPVKTEKAKPKREKTERVKPEPVKNEEEVEPTPVKEEKGKPAPVVEKEIEENEHSVFGDLGPGDRVTMLPDGKMGIAEPNVLYLSEMGYAPISGKLPNFQDWMFPALPALEQGGTPTAIKYVTRLPYRDTARVPIFSTKRMVNIDCPLTKWRPTVGDNDRWWEFEFEKGIKDFPDIRTNRMFELLTEHENASYFKVPGRLMLFGENEKDGGVKLEDNILNWAPRKHKVRKGDQGAANMMVGNDEWDYKDDSRGIGIITDPNGTIADAGYEAKVKYLDIQLEAIKRAYALGYTVVVAGVLKKERLKLLSAKGFMPRVGFSTGVFSGSLEREDAELYHKFIMKVERLAFEECVIRGYEQDPNPNRTSMYVRFPNGT
eukprot:GHVT01074361.1.p1 GENE.GHVT01074361.1~~GHVT01074361.1.p1  ORF type:complete len:545 (+),score=60.97 GHVT01074361.1:648-2282(+)